MALGSSHALPQRPQWAGVDDVLTHAPLQSACVTLHAAHTPFWHASSERHAPDAQQGCPRAPHAAPTSGRSGSENTTSRDPTSGAAPSGSAV